MSSARLLAAALFVCSALAFAQQPSDSLAGPTKPAEASKPVEVAPSRTWRLLPNHELNPEWLQDAPKYAAAKDQGAIEHLLPDPQTQAIAKPPDELFVTESFCLAIRSYVVARDEKDSDSTHLVRSSTCQPMKRYHVRKVDAPQDPANR